MKKKKEKLYKVGELVACVSDQSNKIYILGIITKALKHKKHPNMYDVQWIDDFECEELWDQEQIVRYKEILQEALDADNSKLEKG
jgi:hypothetical protein